MVGPAAVGLDFDEGVAVGCADGSAVDGHRTATGTVGSALGGGFTSLFIDLCGGTGVVRCRAAVDGCVAASVCSHAGTIGAVDGHITVSVCGDPGAISTADGYATFGDGYGALGTACGGARGGCVTCLDGNLTVARVDCCVGGGGCLSGCSGGGRRVGGVLGTAGAQAECCDCCQGQCCRAGAEATVGGLCGSMLSGACHEVVLLVRPGGAVVRGLYG